MYFIIHPGFCQHFFGNIFEISEKERLFIHFSFIFYASALLCEGLGDADAGGRGGKAALAGFAQTRMHLVADFPHRIDHLIRRNAAYDSRKCHVRRRKCIHGTDHIPLDARDLDKTADRVTHETEQVL